MFATLLYHDMIPENEISESWIFLQDIANMSFCSHFAGEEAILDKLSENILTVIINNDSILVTGDKLLGTFDRLEVAELSAKSLTMGAFLRKLIPISDEQDEELWIKFLD